jgi:hypothetical protein
MFIQQSTVVYVKRFLQTNDLGIEPLQVFGYLENTLLAIFYKPIRQIPDIELRIDAL